MARGPILTCKADQNAKIKINPRKHVDFRCVTIDHIDNFQLVDQQVCELIGKLLLIKDKTLEIITFEPISVTNMGTDEVAGLYAFQHARFSFLL
jgi:hypothetical protein